MVSSWFGACGKPVVSKEIIMSTPVKHIVHIIPTLNFGGAERFVVNMCNGGTADMYKHSVIILKQEQPMAQELIHADVHVVQKRGKLSLHLVRDIQKKLEELQPDLVHTHLFGADVWVRLAARRVGVPVVTTEHNVNVGEGMIKHALKRLLACTSVAYTAPSRAIATYIEKEYGVSETTVIPYGIDISAFLKTNPLKLAASEPIKLLIIGRLVEQKGHAVALRALAEMKNDLGINWTGGVSVVAQLRMWQLHMRVLMWFWFHRFGKGLGLWWQKQWHQRGLL